MPHTGSGIAFFTGSSRHIAFGNQFDTCHGAIFSQADHSIQEANIAYNPADSSFVLQGQGCVGSSMVNNKVYNHAGTAANHIGVEEGASDWVISGNYVYGLKGSGIYLFNSAITAGVKGGIIADNIIDGGNGTVTTGGAVIAGIVTTGYYSFCNIHDNTVRNLPSDASSASTLATLWTTNSVFRDNILDATSNTGLVTAVEIFNSNGIAGTPALGPIDCIGNKLLNTGGGRGYMLAAGAYNNQRVSFQQLEIIGGSVGIDANFTVNSGADIWLVNTVTNTATTPINLSSNYPNWASFQTFFNTGGAIVKPHSVQTLAPSVLYGNLLPTSTSGVQNSYVIQSVPTVGQGVGWMKSNVTIWTTLANL